MTRVYLGLGANLDQPVEQLNSAVNALKSLAGTHAHVVSRYYSSKPMGPQDQPDYVNAVMALSTHLTPHQLLDHTQKIEQEHGRVRKAERWGARTLDIDILLFGEQHINDERLTVPHYGLPEREFVLYPLLEIAPQLSLPNGQPIATLAERVDKRGLTPLQQPQ